ncbi:MULTISPECIES: haloacid dehalogenase type II [Rhizobium]|uniref:Haloacid dehalogenase type II n=1 Tax=Rhizobium rhododendri TaxID=2506430 RepID=A0ABY8IQM3_9HYPH|nr:MULTISPECIES: haloacid dehalogenase type II [Rhizobium]TQX86011.1 haloacid dehalogenase type II [Rhizobium sp. rho-13.1]TQY10975.1 haloacid dehalogenase type II [Rhizobium sp. rho-1.1]WFS25806.1 haloacid dehalogenase type II [Rhizobium rhododendri]
MPDPNALMFTLDPAPKVITFDCYGTLVQWYEVLLREIGAILTAHDAGGASATKILESFSAQGQRLTAERPHRLYKDVLRLGFAAAFAEHGLTPTAAEIDRIASSPMVMGPHPEVPNVLRRLRERYKLAIFTNSDDDLIAPTVARIGVPFDYVITAEQAQAYKPSRQLFEYAYREMGVTPSETVHVAMGMYWDMKARHELGLRGIWVNRRREVGNSDWRPYAEVSDLNGVAALLLPA